MQLVSWRFLKNGPAILTANNYVDGAFSVTVGITLVAAIHSSFSFSVIDSIDKDQVSLESAKAGRRVSTTVDVDMSVSGSSEYTGQDGMFQDRTSVDVPRKKIAAAAVNGLPVDVSNLLKADPLIHVSLYECDCRRQRQHRRR